MSLSSSSLIQIAALRERYYSVITGKASLLQLIDEAELSEHVYNSNAIENSTLNLEETEKILLKIELDRYISERELFEAKNLARVSRYISEQAIDRAMNIDMLLLLHHMLISNIRDDIAGRFRRDNEWVRVGSHIAAPPDQVTTLLEHMFNSYHAKPLEHIIKKIALLHLTFEHVHPFVDGNGRIGRVLNNYMLIREGYVPINISFVDRKAYYQAFKEFDTHQKTTTMETIIGRALTNSYHKRLAYLEGKTIITLAAYAKQSTSSHSNLLNKAKRQTIPAFFERGVWKIGV